MRFAKNDAVSKKKGYRFFGIVVAAFTTLGGEERYVVESTSYGSKQMLFIFNDGQLESDYASLAAIHIQNGEFDALNDLAKRWDTLQRVPVVDDDYPEVRSRYEGTMMAFLRACAETRPEMMRIALGIGR